jgi:hypothetical protein
MNPSQFKPFKKILRRFDLQPNIRECDPVVKRDPTVIRYVQDWYRGWVLQNTRC